MINKKANPVFMLVSNGGNKKCAFFQQLKTFVRLRFAGNQQASRCLQPLLCEFCFYQKQTLHITSQNFRRSIANVKINL